MRKLQILSLALSILSAAAIALAPAASMAQTGKLNIDLNKFEPAEGGGCRAFFLFRNQTGLSFEGLEMSLAILDSAGVIDRLLTIDAAPIPVGRTTLKLFEIPETPCESISEILLHEIASCRPQNAEEMDCFSILNLTSRTPARLVQ